MITNGTPGFVQRWLATLPEGELARLAPDPAATAVFSADMINGFVHDGALSSPRVNAIIKPVVDVFQAAWEHGVREFVLLQDTHDPETSEFRAYPPHCIASTPESVTIPELARLPGSDFFTIIPKNSLNPAIETAFDRWLDDHPDINTAVVVGNCTDLCVYQLAMHLRMRANALNLATFDVIVPATAVQTFDIPETSETIAGQAHPGDFFHDVFLYHMAANGIRIVASIA